MNGTDDTAHGAGSSVFAMSDRKVETTMTMMSKFKSNRLIVAGALVGVMAIGGTAMAKGFGRGGGFPLMRIMRHLDLTEEQEIQAVKIRRAMREKRKAAREQRRATLSQVHAELGKETPDPQILHAAIDQAAAQMTAGMHEAVDQFLTLHQTFTPEQREELTRVMAKMKKRHEHRRARNQSGN